MTTATSTAAPATLPATLCDVPAGALVVFSYYRDGQTTTVTGRKGQPVNAHLGRDHGIDLLDDAGQVVATVSRYAHVQVVLA